MMAWFVFILMMVRPAFAGSPIACFLDEAEISVSIQDIQPSRNLSIRRHPVGERTVVLDTNIMAHYLQHRDKATDLHGFTVKSLFVEMRKLWAGADFRVSDVTIYEMSKMARVPELPGFVTGVKVQGGVRVTREYRELLRLLEVSSVGRGKGHMDRMIIADLVFADQTKMGLKPNFVTADVGILRGLMRIARGEKAVHEGQYRQPFDVELPVGDRVRTIRVVPLIDKVPDQRQTPRSQ